MGCRNGSPHSQPKTNKGIHILCLPGGHLRRPNSLRWLHQLTLSRDLSYALVLLDSWVLFPKHFPRLTIPSGQEAASCLQITAQYFRFMIKVKLREGTWGGGWRLSDIVHTHTPKLETFQQNQMSSMSSSSPPQNLFKKQTLN